MTPRWKEREFYVMVIGNIIGLGMAFGILNPDTAKILGGQSSEVVTQVFQLVGGLIAAGTTVGFQVSRGLAKSGK